MIDEIVERVARALCADLGRQDLGDEWELPADLKLAYLDQGEVDFGQLARAALEAAGYERLREALTEARSDIDYACTAIQKLHEHKARFRLEQTLAKIDAVVFSPEEVERGS